jgi:hypothetical protein
LIAQITHELNPFPEGASDSKVESTIGVRFRQLKEKTVEEVAKVNFLISRQLLKVNSLKFVITFS